MVVRGQRPTVRGDVAQNRRGETPGRRRVGPSTRGKGPRLAPQVAEQWAVNLRAACPALRVVVASANKALAALTACANDIACNGATPSENVFPSGSTAAEAVRGAVALAVTHSGQSFPTLNAARALKDAGADVFAVSGQLDVVLADILGQSFAAGSDRSDRLLATGAGIRLAEAASCTTAATHVLLTELLFVVAGEAEGALRVEDLNDLLTLHGGSVRTGGNVSEICSGEGPGGEAASLGRSWGDHAVEPLLTWFLAVCYVIGTVAAAFPVVAGVGTAAGLRETYLYAFFALDALLYAFFANVAAVVLRLVQGREPLARFGKRTLLVLDVPMVDTAERHRRPPAVASLRDGAGREESSETRSSSLRL